MEKIKINLSSDSIKDAINKLNEYKSSLNQRLDSAMEEIASSGTEKASSLWDGLPFTPTHTKPTFSYEKISNGYRITVKGKGVSFDEYGTGLNAQLPHIGICQKLLHNNIIMAKLIPKVTLRDILCTIPLNGLGKITRLL